MHLVHLEVAPDPAPSAPAPSSLPKPPGPAPAAPAPNLLHLAHPVLLVRLEVAPEPAPGAPSPTSLPKPPGPAPAVHAPHLLHQAYPVPLEVATGPAPDAQAPASFPNTPGRRPTPATGPLHRVPPVPGPALGPLPSELSTEPQGSSRYPRPRLCPRLEQCTVHTTRVDTALPVAQPAPHLAPCTWPPFQVLQGGILLPHLAPYTGPPHPCTWPCTWRPTQWCTFPAPGVPPTHLEELPLPALPSRRHSCPARGGRGTTTAAVTTPSGTMPFPPSSTSRRRRATSPPPRAPCNLRPPSSSMSSFLARGHAGSAVFLLAPHQSIRNALDSLKTALMRFSPADPPGPGPHGPLRLGRQAHAGAP